MHGPKPGQQVTAGLGFCPDSISFSGIQKPNSRICFALRKYNHHTRNVYFVSLQLLLLLFPAYSKRSKKKEAGGKNLNHTHSPPPHPPKKNSLKPTEMGGPNLALSREK